MRTIVCEKCHKVFIGRNKNRRFCSNLCVKNAAYVKIREVDGYERLCSLLGCPNKVWYFPRQIKANKKRFCSRGCNTLALYKQSPLICVTCSATYRKSPSQEKWRGKSKFCSKKCKGLLQSETQKGDKNPWWRGGVSPENRRIRYSARMAKWRKAIFERDNYTCQICGIRGGYLEADHIKQFAYYPELRFELTNGRTLCKPCHRKTPTYGKREEALSC